MVLWGGLLLRGTLLRLVALPVVLDERLLICLLRPGHGARTTICIFGAYLLLTGCASLDGWLFLLLRLLLRLVLLLLLRAIVKDQGANHIVVEHLGQIGRLLVYLHLRLILLSLAHLMQLLIATLLVLICSVILMILLILLLILLTAYSLKTFEKLKSSACGLCYSDRVVRLAVRTLDLVGLFF